MEKNMITYSKNGKTLTTGHGFLEIGQVLMELIKLLKFLLM